MTKNINVGDKKKSKRVKIESQIGHVPFPGALTGCRLPFPLPRGVGGTTGCFRGLLLAAASPDSSVSAGHTSIESAPQRCSSLDVLCKGVGFFVGSLPFSTVSEACVVSVLRWLVPAAAQTSRPRVEDARCTPPDSLREGCSADTRSCSWT